ncbi:MAG: hypothetical protein MUE96_09830 [Bacteroidia bacterium]|jgi:hypothetical protein|nr:hypothetical protein [Bacteroidia bacterium]
METNYVLILYSIYLPVTVALTYYVAKTLFKNAKVFMLEIFHGKEDIAYATNHLFQVGFYLLNLGFSLLMLKTSYDVYSSTRLFEITSLKIGGFSIYLGVMLFLNVYLFFRGKRKSKGTDTVQ